MEITVTLAGGKRVEAEIRGYRVETDQPKEAGGDGAAPTPFDLFLASIAACSGFYVLDFCRARNIATEGIGVVARTEVDAQKRMIGKIAVEIQLPPEFPERYRVAVVRAADACSVKKHILDPPVFDVYATVGGSRV